MPIRAVLFDLGDTLWHFPNFPDDATVTAASARRIEDCLRAWDLCDGVACPSLAAAIRAAQWQHTLDAEHSHGRSPDFAALSRTCAARHGLSLTDEQSAALWDAWNLGGAFYGRTVFPDTIPTLDELHRRGYRLGVVTNRALGGPRFRDELRDAGLLDHFETIAVSCDDGWLKPHPALFQRALDDLELPPEEVVMVGDNLRADVMGAKALGMTTVWKRPPGLEQQPAPLPGGTLALPDYTIDHPVELLTLPILTPSTRHDVRSAMPTRGAGDPKSEG